MDFWNGSREGPEEGHRAGDPLLRSLFSLKRRIWEDFIGDFQYLQRDYRKRGRGGNFLSGSVLVRQGVMLLNLNKVDLD